MKETKNFMEKYKDDDDRVTARISRVSFIFVSFVIISGGYTTQLLSCDTQRLLKNNIYVKHLAGFLLIFMFIMLEGGWDFFTDNLNSSTNWSNGNCLASLIQAFIVYIIFVLSSKMKIIYTILFFGLLFILYIFNTQRLYLKNKNQIDEKTNHLMVQIEGYLFTILLPIILLIGIYNYYLLKKKQKGKNFSIITFFIGNNICK